MNSITYKKQKRKFRTFLINKQTLIRFSVYLTLALTFFLLIYIAPYMPRIPDMYLNTFAKCSFSACLPDVNALGPFIIKHCAAKAAGLEMPQSVLVAEIPFSTHDPYPNLYIPIEETQAAPTPAPPPTDQNIKEKSFESANTVTIDNKTTLNVDTAALLSAPVPLKNTPGQPLVLIVHTHTTESYTPSEKYDYTPQSNSRTTDPDFNMIKVGKEFAKGLSDAG